MVILDFMNHLIMSLELQLLVVMLTNSVVLTLEEMLVIDLEYD